MAPNVNDPHVHKSSLSLISNDSCTPENSRTNSIWRGRMSQGIGSGITLAQNFRATSRLRPGDLERCFYKQGDNRLHVAAVLTC